MIRRGAAALAAAAVVAALPTSAQAKTFNARFSDPEGDAKPAARDITAGRVAYNRKSGALSATVQVAADYAESREDAIVVVIVSDLVRGRCRAVRMTLGVALSDPAVPMAWKGETQTGKRYLGSGSIEGDTLKLRVKSKALSGQTPGCTMIYLATAEDEPTIIDQTAIDNGFA
jgi:hypothetical protein